MVFWFKCVVVFFEIAKCYILVWENNKDLDSIVLQISVFNIFNIWEIIQKAPPETSGGAGFISTLSQFDDLPRR